MRFIVVAGSQTLPVEITGEGGSYRVRLAEEWIAVDGHVSPAGSWSLLIAGFSHLADVHEENGEIVVALHGESHRVRVDEPGRVSGRGGGAGARSGGQRLVAPMPGRVVRVHVQPGDRVEPGAPLVVLEAMKMENEFRATAGGAVAEVRVTAGQAVNAGDVLVIVSPPGA